MSWRLILELLVSGSRAGEHHPEKVEAHPGPVEAQTGPVETHN